MLQISDEFGYWFSGLVDGEGCFMCDYDKRNGKYSTRFLIGCRVDDENTLEYIQRNLDLGILYARSGCRVKGTDYVSAPVAVFQVGRIKDCQKLVTLFDKYPLRSKKAGDYEIWKKIVCEQSKPVSARNRRYMHELKVALTAIKEYSNNDVKMPEPSCQQLEFGL